MGMLIARHRDRHDAAASVDDDKKAPAKKAAAKKPASKEGTK